MTKILIALLLFLLLAVGIGIYRFNAQQPSGLVEKPQPKSQPQVTLSLLPATVAATSGQPTFVRADINAHGVIPTLVQLEIAYDPTALGNITITPGDFFPNPLIQLSKIDMTTGRISYAVSTKPGDALAQHAGTVAIIAFTPYGTAVKRQTQLSFLPKTMTRTEKQVLNVQTTYGTTIEILPTTLQKTYTATISAH